MKDDTAVIARNPGASRPSTMEYQTAIQTFEVQRGNGPLGIFGTLSTLILKITVDSEHSLASEMRQVNAQFLGWLARQGRKCGDLVLEFTAPMALRAEIEASISRLLLQAREFNDVIQALQTDCTLQDPKTGEVRILGAFLRPCREPDAA